MNKERKQYFVEQRRKEVEVASNINSWFNLAEFFEDSFGKDAAEWDSGEIMQFMKFMNTPRPQTLVVLVNTFRIYADWCLQNGNIPGNQNHWYEITIDDICECYDKETFDQCILTREQLYEKINMLLNYSDKLIFAALFEGVKAAEIVKIDSGSLNGNMLTVGKASYTVSEDLRDIILEAVAESEYITMGDKHQHLEYVDEDYGCAIKRVIYKNRIGLRSNVLTIMGDRYRKSLRYMQLPTWISRKDIAECGRLDFLRKSGKEITVSYIVDRNADHSKLYGYVQNGIVYLKTYGRFL